LFEDKTGIFSFYQHSTSGKAVVIATALHFVSFLMHISGAKFQEHCFNISRNIVYSVLHHF